MFPLRNGEDLLKELRVGYDCLFLSYNEMIKTDRFNEAFSQRGIERYEMIDERR